MSLVGPAPVPTYLKWLLLPHQRETSAKYISILTSIERIMRMISLLRISFDVQLEVSCQ